MREYGKVQTAFWGHPKVRSLSDDGRLLALYLFTGPQSNSVGAYHLPDGYIAADLAWAGERVSATLSELFGKGFQRRFADGCHIAVCDFIQWNKPENPNVLKNMIKAFDTLPKDPCRIYPLLGILGHTNWIPAADRNRLESLSKALKSNPSETLSKPFRKPEPKPEPEPEVILSSLPFSEPDNLLLQNQVSVREETSVPVSSESDFLPEGKIASDSPQEPESPEARATALAKRIGDHATRMRAKGAPGWTDSLGEGAVALRPNGAVRASEREDGPGRVKPNGAVHHDESADVSLAASPPSAPP